MDDGLSKERDPNSIPARISRIMVESEQRRFRAQELSASMPGLTGTFAETWASISGGAQDTRDQLQQQAMEQLMAQLPSEEARKEALKAGLTNSARWWFDQAKQAQQAEGTAGAMDILKRAQVRVRELKETSELLDKPKDPQAR